LKCPQNRGRTRREDSLRTVGLTKSVDWEYEQEWRIFNFSIPDDDRYAFFSPEELTGVIFGARISDYNKEWIKSLVQLHPTKIDLKQAVIDDVSFKLNIVSID